MQWGIYLLLEKLKLVAYRNLFKRVCVTAVLARPSKGLSAASPPSRRHRASLGTTCPARASAWLSRGS